MVLLEAVNCTDDPVGVHNSEKGMYDWDESLANKSYTLKIRYYCPLTGWGYPSNGMPEMFSVCQADKQWSLQGIEECISMAKHVETRIGLGLIVLSDYLLELPCPEQPPAKPEGGWFWYGVEQSRFKCTNGYQFAPGEYPYWYTSCTPSKVWDPPTMEECVRKFLDNVNH